MELSYKQSAHTQVKTVGETMVLFRTDKAAAFSLNETGRILWRALPEFPTAEALTALMAEARPQDDPDIQREEILLFLGRLVSLGLVHVSGPLHLRKASDITSETVGDELIVFKESRKKVHAFNDTGAVLWAALDHYPRQDQLVELLAQAWPDKDPAELRRLVTDFTMQLLDLGFIEYQPGGDAR